MSSNIALIEPTPIVTEFCSGVAHVEDMGACVCFVLYADQIFYEAGNVPVRVVQKRIVMPLDAVKPGVDMTLRFLAKRLGGAIIRRL